MSKTIIGLTGLIGTGKSAVAGLLKELGCAVFDADAFVHKLYQDEKVQQKLEASVFATSNRTKIAELLHKNPLHKNELEAILHPLVREKEEQFVRANQREKNVVLDVPLLMQTGADELCDVVWVTTCSPETQRERVLARPGFTEERLRQILEWQGDGSLALGRADLVIDTEKPLETLALELRGELQKLDA